MIKLFQKLLRIITFLYLLNTCFNKFFNKSQWSIFANAQSVQVKVGVLLDMESMEGKIGLSCINVAISDFYAAHPEFNTRIVVHVRDSKDHDIIMAAAAVSDLLKNEQVVAIIGRKTSVEAQFVLKLSEKSQVPIVSYSSTSHLLSPSQNPYFIRVAPDDSTQVHPISALVEVFGWREVVLVYDASESGGGIIPFLVDKLQEVGVRIPYRGVISTNASDDQIETELHGLKNVSTRVFVVLLETSLGSRLFLKAKQMDMMSDEYVWIIGNGMADSLDSLDPRVNHSMQGVLGVKTNVNRTKDLDDFIVRWKTKFQQENPLITDAVMNIDGLRAYDATTALARAVEKVGTTNFTFQNTNNPANLSTSNISETGVSLFGPQLLESIMNLRFMGLGGNFDLVEGHLQSSTFQIINIWGSREKEICFWSQSSGLSVKLSSVNNSMSAIKKSELKSIIWPGGSTDAPKGWVVSPNGKRLKIGVPVSYGQFVNVAQDPATNKTIVTGYCIDVFDAVIKKLPYSVHYDYYPFTETEGQVTASYDTLVSQVYLKKYDAVVGDTTIRAKRTVQVDFTFPYTESGVIMVVPVKYNTNIRAWLFVRPLTWDLWVVAFCSFVFIAFVVWVLEHRINEDFRGPPGNQAGTSLYYSFSTLVFSHSANVFSNLTRFVVIIWVFVVLILIQSYTASLTSLLTVEQLQPTITDVKELIKEGENVGFSEGSFVQLMLLELNFSRSNIKPYISVDQMHQLLEKGTKKGGIAAAFEELPYVKVFLGKYCSKYTMVPPVYKSNGFGFVFPKGSPLGADVSREVLNLTEGKEMIHFENKWFKDTACRGLGESQSSNSLGVDSFWGLFTIAWGAALFAIIMSLAHFFEEHMNIWSEDSSFWTKIKTFMKVYDEKNLNFFTFKKSLSQDQNIPRASSDSSNPHDALFST